MMLEAARYAGHPNVGPEGQRSGGCSEQDRVRIPAHERLYPCPDRVARFGLGVNPWQNGTKATIADQPVDGTDPSKLHSR